MSPTVRPTRWRLFIAHPLPADVRRTLRRRLAPYRARHLDVRWTPPDSWHLTLLFLGSVEPRRVPELEEVVSAVARQGEPYEVRIERAGGRIRKAEGVAWLELGVGARTLIETADLAAALCPPDVTAGPPPRRTPSAHLTVARNADESVIASLRTQEAGPLGLTWTVDRILLVRSHLERGGARYETLSEAAL